MKKRHQDWLKLTSLDIPIGPKSLSIPKTPITVIELSGFQEIEDKLWLYSSKGGVFPPEIDTHLDQLSLKTFGITKQDTVLELPEGYSQLPEWSSDRWSIEDRYYDHEDQFETAEATDDEAAAILLDLGLDFRDKKGLPLRCTKLFCRQAEAAAKGIAGKMPDMASAELDVWAKKLEQDAKDHFLKKRMR